jgi:hypothetical protein
MNETWKQIADFPDYEISDLGNIRNIETHQEPTITFNHNGYRTAYLKKYREHKIQLVHRLVLQTFVRPFKKGEVSNHINFNRSDNRLSNLEIISQYQNVQHSKDRMGKWGGINNKEFIRRQELRNKYRKW